MVPSDVSSYPRILFAPSGCRVTRVVDTEKEVAVKLIQEITTTQMTVERAEVRVCQDSNARLFTTSPNIASTVR